MWINPYLNIQGVQTIKENHNEGVVDVISVSLENSYNEIGKLENLIANGQLTSEDSPNEVQANLS